MTFSHPLILLLLLLPVAIGGWQWLRPGRAVMFPFDHQHATHRATLDTWTRAATLLPLVLGAAAIVALAGPQRDAFRPVPRDVRNIQFLLDVSASMTSPFGDGRTRHDAAMDAIEAFTAHRKGDAFGLTLFGGEVLTWIPLTKDLGPIRLARPFLDYRALPPRLTGGTATGLGLTSLCRQFNDAPPGERIVICITDGNAGDIDDDGLAALVERLRAARATVYTILTNDQPDSPRMDTLCQQTGGELFAAGDPDALNAVFDRIDQVTTSKFAPMARTSVDDFKPVALAILGLSTIYALTLSGLRYTPW